MMSRRTEISNVGTNAVDRISECPDSVLVHILSLLPIKDAVKTEVLSKRWQFLWTFLPSLVFTFPFIPFSHSDDEDTIVGAKTGFATFVDKTLFFSNRYKLEKFGVFFYYEPRFASSVNSWTRFAAGKGVEELQLGLFHEVPYLDEGGSYELPQLLYENSWFKKLKFLYCKVIPKRDVAWYSLKNLTLWQAELTNDAIERILAGSPVLEILELDSCTGFSRLAVTNSCVKKVILRDLLCTSDEVDDELEISAPYLLSLKITGCLIGNFDSFIGRGCRFTDVSSLVDAVFNFARISDEDWANDYERIHNIVGGILASLLHVKNLTLGTWALEAVSMMEAKGLNCSFLNCKCLTLHTEINKYVFPGIASMLKRTPNLETLIMDLSFFSAEWMGMKPAELCNYNEENYWTSQKWTYKCLTLHLKNVTFTSTSMMFQSNDDQSNGDDSINTSFFSFAQFLLRNARVLQKMVIRKPRDDRLKEYFNTAQKLLSYPRSSPDAAVIFC